jgi:hypothetical protein
VSYVATHGRNPAGKPRPNAGQHRGPTATSGHEGAGRHAGPPGSSRTQPQAGKKK